MGRVTPQVVSLITGLNSQASAAGLPLGQHAVATNVRFSDGAASRRKGIGRVSAPTTAERLGSSIMFSIGTTGYAYIAIPYHASVWALPTTWTLDIVVSPDDLPAGGTAQHRILGFSDGSLYMDILPSGAIFFSLTDAASATFTLTSATTYAINDVVPIRIVRDGATLTMRINGQQVASRNDLTADSASLTTTDDLLVGAQTEGFIGLVDDLRLFHVALDGQPQALCEWPDPRTPALQAYYRFGQQTGAWADVTFDESRFQNHADVMGDVTFTSGLVTTLNPVIGIHQHHRSSGSRKILIAMGESLFESRVV